MYDNGVVKYEVITIFKKKKKRFVNNRIDTNKVFIDFRYVCGELSWL